MKKGKIIAGDFDKILVRKKAGTEIQLGELLICKNNKTKFLLQAFDLAYGSQLNQKSIELAGGLSLERTDDLEFMDPDLRNYNISALKPLIEITGNKVSTCKKLPDFFSDVNALEEADLSFLTKPSNAIFLGKLRSGTTVFDSDIYVDGKQALTHHMLIPATTGRGKSNLTKCILWDLAKKDFVSCLILDPHDEYYGRSGLGLKDHPNKDNIHYYTTKQVPPGGKTLKINIEHLKPNHFNGVLFLSDPQMQAMYLYYQRFKEKWIKHALDRTKISGVKFDETTLDVLKRKLMTLLGIEEKVDFGKVEYTSYGIFDFKQGVQTIPEILNNLEKGSMVIIDTSSLSGSIEILVGSIVANEIFRKYQLHKMNNVKKPIVSVVLEEAPRVLANDQSIFSTIAREGRKFSIGLIAITQLPSLIPRQILANMNTKIILGLEMAPERQAIIESASQDLSGFSRNIASLDKGEAIITSNFTKFAVPVKIPLFEDYAKREKTHTVNVEGIL